MADDELDHFWETNFNTTNFLSAWYYMEGYINVDKCTELGKFYMTSESSFLLNLRFAFTLSHLYSIIVLVQNYADFCDIAAYQTLCITTMKYLEDPANLNLREELLRTYDELPMHPKYRQEGNEVDSDQFFRVSERVRNQRKPRKVLDGSVINRNMRGATVPPLKGLPASEVQPETNETDQDDVFGGQIGTFDGAYDAADLKTQQGVLHELLSLTHDFL
jgi:hypothetical protein